MAEIFPLTRDADGIATLCWDLPGASMNVLTEGGILELEEKIPALIADPAVKGVILTSAKADFSGGMDLPTILDYLGRARQSDDPAGMLFAFTMRLHRLLRLIERGGMDPKTLKGGKPFVWASPGTAVGIGTELALACHYRVAAENPKARIGLPEIKVGIFPGSGGTTRLIRMLGLMGASEYLLQGKLVAPDKAQKAGLIDEVVPPDDLIAAAKTWIASATEESVVKPWDRKGYKIPGGAPYTVPSFPIFVGGMALAHGKTRGVYPAVRAMLSAIYEGAMVDFDDALRIEARHFTSVLLDPSAEAMIRTLFVNKQALEKGAARPTGVPDLSVRKVGILGSGMMGAGIAGAAASAGIEVVLVDRDQPSVERGIAAITSLLDKRISRRRETEAGKAEILARILPTTGYDDLAGCDLIVEAVFEDPVVKAEVTARAEAVIPTDAIFATNTSTLPIADLARASQRPERFIGIHFFSPVDRMMLVEIIRGAETGPEAVAKALDFVRQLRKTPIVVNDARFFYANRCIIPYGQEGARMVAEGVAPALIENAAKQAGMPLGPLQLTDETSLELALSISRATMAAMGEAYPASPADDLIRAMVEGYGRTGRKGGAGFYDYDAAGKRTGLWPGLAEHYPLMAPQPSLAEVMDRLLYVQALEAVRVFEEGVLTDIAEGDVGAILGWGFAPWSGGPFGWLDIVGAARAVARCRELATAYGQRFEPPALLCGLAEAGDGFYGRFARR
ncbi:enoyl-CoA hydratase/isomerase family protein [Rhodobacteraceae bacterium NNCM2]|nr:enoyl-CoA hydratase/isomerase family protein [Coraliihabitans acroporae]